MSFYELAWFAATLNHSTGEINRQLALGDSVLSERGGYGAPPGAPQRPSRRTLANVVENGVGRSTREMTSPTEVTEPGVSAGWYMDEFYVFPGR